MFFFVTAPLESVLNFLSGIALVIVGGILVLALLGFADSHPVAADNLVRVLFWGVVAACAIVRYDLSAHRWRLRWLPRWLVSHCRHMGAQGPGPGSKALP